MTSVVHETQWADATAQAELVRSRKVSAIELLEAAIQRVETINPKINAVNITWFDHARQIAKDIDSQKESDTAEPFRGVPFILKDLSAPYAGQHMSNGNIALKNAHYITPQSSELVKRFIAAGLVTLGRGNSPEFGSVPTTEPLAWGPTHNPYDLSRTSGGSSGGSAAAVASGIVPIAHASDGGGSIRIPASCCGLVGLKVSQGRISAAPFADESNLSVQFAVTRTVRDCAALLDATHGPGVGDRVIAPSPKRPFLQEVGAPVEKLRIGILDHHPMGGTIDEECRDGVQAAAKLLESLGHDVEQSWPKALEDSESSRRFSALWSTNMSVSREALSAMLNRPATIDDIELVNWTMMEYAKHSSATDYAMAVSSTVTYRRQIAQWWADGFDILVTPTVARLPLKLGTIANDPKHPMRPMDVAGDFVPFTPPFNTSGQPAMSLPLHWTSSGLPVGIQFVAAYGRDDLLLRLAAQLEVAQPWAHRRPTFATSL
ncbi:MAG: amidase [Ilumatobacteraceae bacterium]